MTRGRPGRPAQTPSSGSQLDDGVAIRAASTSSSTCTVVRPAIRAGVVPSLVVTGDLRVGRREVCECGGQDGGARAGDCPEPHRSGPRGGAGEFALGRREYGRVVYGEDSRRVRL
ncbi:hypothetical protein ACFY7Z_28045 [Streptomyces sp. NPDC012623]|uniref:hypothetical protein n=1 Tax=unclassified Streptomyces TaxID=2593676 RepID=UPI00367C24B7